jgi:hypothetical protein
MHDLAMTEPQKEKARARMRLCCVCSLLAALAVAVSACGDEPTSDAPTATAPAVETQPSPTKLEWLKQTDPIAPEQWLASRQAGRDLDLYDRSVGAMRSTLEVAAARFRDHPRMIANRAVQLEEMLKEKNIDEPASEIIVTLCEVPGKTRYVESFSSLTQQYYNLRMDGLDKGQAIAALKRQNDANQ